MATKVNNETVRGPLKSSSSSSLSSSSSSVLASTMTTTSSIYTTISTSTVISSSTAMSTLHARMIASVRVGDALELAHILTSMKDIKNIKDDKKEGVNTPTISGDYALHLAARLQGQAGIDCIATLIKHKAKIHVRDAKGRTPMHHAAAFGRVSALLELIKHGGKLDACDAAGNTPIDVVLRASCSTIKKSDDIYEIHTWGKGSNLALGHGDMDNRAAPKKVVKLAGVDINKAGGISCSKLHTVVCTSRGDAYSWGIGTGGRLGLGDETHRLIPMSIPTLPRIVFVACSISHSAFITQDGHVFTCGANESGQLGLGDTEPRTSPKRIRWKEDLSDAIVSVALSPSHSVALTSRGQVWTWGRDNESQLGIGPSNKRFQTEPRLVPLFAGTLSLTSAPLYGVHIAAGQGFTVVSTSTHDITIFGYSRLSPTRFVLEHPRAQIASISVSGSGSRGIAVNEAGHVFEWQFTDPPTPSRIAFPLVTAAMPTIPPSPSPPTPRIYVRNAITTDDHILLVADSGNVYYYEYPPTSIASTPPQSPSASLRRLPIQRAIAISTSESHSVVIAGACVPAEPLELAQSSFSADFAALAGSILFSDMSFTTSEGHIIPAHRIIVSRMPQFHNIAYGASIALHAPRVVVDAFLPILYSSSMPHPSLLDKQVLLLLENFKHTNWIPLVAHLSKRLVDGLYSDMTLSTEDAEHPENMVSQSLHRVVMAARCDYFLAMSTSGMREAMPLPFEDSSFCDQQEGSRLTTSLELSSALFEHIVTYIYTDSINKPDYTTKNKTKERNSKKSGNKEPTNSINFWLELLAAADQLMLPQLKTIAANMVLPHLRVDNVGSVISVAADIDPYDTRLQEACLDYMRDNLDIMLAAKALEDVSSHILAMLDEKLNPLSEEESSLVGVPGVSKSKPKKVRDNVESFYSTSFEQESLPSPQSPLCSASAPSPSTSFSGLSETPPSRKALKKQMKLLKLQQSQSQDIPPLDTNQIPQNEEFNEQEESNIPETVQEETPQIQPPTESKRKKQAMKRIVGFDPVLIAQALSAPIKREPPPSTPPKPAWSVDTKAKSAAPQPISLLEIQKQQTPTKSKMVDAPAPRSVEKFSSGISLEQFLAPQKEKKKEKDKPFSWGAQSAEKTDLVSLAAEQAAKGKREQVVAPPQPPSSSAKPKMSLAAYIHAEQHAKDERIKALNRPTKPIATIEMEERALQQITRLYEAELAASTPNPTTNQQTSSQSKKSQNKRKSPRKRECIDTRPMEIKFASSC